MKLLRHRLLLPALVGLAVGVVVALFVLSEAQAQGEPVPDPSQVFAKNLYVTHLQMAQKEVAALKWALGGVGGLIVVLVTGGVAWGKNSRATAERLAKHSAIHVSHGVVHGDLRTSIDETGDQLSRLRIEVVEWRSELRLEVAAVKAAVEDLAQAEAKADARELLEEVRALIVLQREAAGGVA